MHILLSDFDPSDEGHIDYFLEHLECYTLGEQTSIYNIIDVEIKRQSWQTYCLYNIKDVDLVDKLDNKMGLIDLVFAIAYDAKINFQDALTTIRAWDVIIHNYLLEKNVVVPPIAVPEYNNTIIGAYVKDPQVGLHRWVVSFDLNSLYPSLIQQYNISPETHVSGSSLREKIAQERRRRDK